MASPATATNPITTSSEVDRQLRRTLLTPQRVKELSVLRPLRAIADISASWIAILAGVVLVSRHPAWWTVLIAIVLIGNRYYALFIVGHDAMHRRLFPNIKRNDFWADLLIFAPIGAITRLNNRNHLSHHRNLATAQDPDRFKHCCFNKAESLSLLTFLSGLASIGHAFKAVFVTRGRSDAKNDGQPAHDAPNPYSDSASADGYTLRDFALLAGWFLVGAGGLTYFVGWWAYPVLWLFPVYCFMYLADNFRSFAEHSHPESDSLADQHRLITYLSYPLERGLVAPNNMNFHAAHHLWPSIPYYNLPTADEEIRGNPAGSHLEWRKSYFGYLLRYWSSLPLVECQESKIQ
jgi:fatty acid desaturase